jgi:hypothetical protein
LDESACKSWGAIFCIITQYPLLFRSSSMTTGSTYISVAPRAEQPASIDTSPASGKVVE